MRGKALKLAADWWAAQRCRGGPLVGAAEFCTIGTSPQKPVEECSEQGCLVSSVVHADCLPALF